MTTHQFYELRIQDASEALGISSKIGVIGAGQMGNGIAHVCALSATMSCC